jgi:uncharacterized protein DUF2726
MNFQTVLGSMSPTEKLLLVVVGILLAILIIDSFQRTRRSRKYYWPTFQQRHDLTDVGQQLHAVMTGSFEKQRLMNSAEYRVFAIVEKEIAAHTHRGYRVFAQTSLGEILRSPNDDAFRSINSKRVDILIVDRNGWPSLAIEYQGEAHYMGTAAGRDAVKREALRKAGVRYLEFRAGDTDDHIRWRLREELGIKDARLAKV